MDKPCVLLGARVPDAFVQRLAQAYEMLGPLPAPFPVSVAALSRNDAQRVRALVTMGTVDTSRALGPESHVVNIARGSVVDEAALIAALRDGVVALPHVVVGTLDAQAAMQDLVWSNLDAFFAGGPVLTPVSAHAGH